MLTLMLLEKYLNMFIILRVLLKTRYSQNVCMYVCVFIVNISWY